MNKYEKSHQDLLEELDWIEKDENIMNTLDMQLSNDGEEIDYDAWYNGFTKFMSDNEVLLKAMAK